MGKNIATNWNFIDEKGTFSLPVPHRTSYLYFPLVNEAGMMSSITPNLNGDIKTDQNTYLTQPVSVEDLHNSRLARNFWVYVEGYGPWSATGNSAAQLSRQFTQEDAEEVSLEAGFLWHKVTRYNPRLALKAEITNFVPSSEDRVELMKVTLTNTGAEPLPVKLTAAIPIYARSADNLRDHRHVTSLLHRIHCHTYGVSVHPTLSFDERGHKPNKITYTVLGMEGGGMPPRGFYPSIEGFIGEGGTLDWPEAIVRIFRPSCLAGESSAGHEALGALRYRDTVLEAKCSKSYLIILAIMDESEDVNDIVKAYGDETRFDEWLRRTQAYWSGKLNTLRFQTNDPRFDLWMRWVAVQPTLRRLFGNSFLPYHDYGRGGRGWRDLWQDILALLVLETGNVSELLFNNYAGVRIDGSNATIIGTKPGEFKADRNNIPRVWMDHGAWPLLTTRFYIDQIGDLAILLREQVYFKDHLIYRSGAIDSEWDPVQGTQLRTTSGEPYRGTILEHILIQHLTQFYNVGEHNVIRLEGADWNDGMDMAPRRGESVAFTALYASNLRQLSELTLLLGKLGQNKVEIAAEMAPLLDRLTTPVDYDSVIAKQGHLAAYFESVRGVISGDKISIPLKDLSKDLGEKADWLFEHLRANEWIKNDAGHAWFNGYYDDDGKRVEGDHPDGVRMTLTGQVFTLMGGIATEEQAQDIVAAADRYLLDPKVGGYRLNTNFHQVLLNLGRCFGFAFGHKENGAMFSHMAVMYAYALYQRGLVWQAHKVLDRIYRHVSNFAVSRMYPGIPEYIDPSGRGVYTYLTGSASWCLLTMVTQVFGVRGILGDLALSPKLVRSQFNSVGDASITTLFAGIRLRVTYHNPQMLDYGDYQIKAIRLDDAALGFNLGEDPVILKRDVINALDAQRTHHMDVLLGNTTKGTDA